MSHEEPIEEMPTIITTLIVTLASLVLWSIIAGALHVILG